MLSPDYIDVNLEPIAGIHELVRERISPLIKGFPESHRLSASFMITMILSNSYVKWSQGMTLSFCLDRKAYTREKIGYVNYRIHHPTSIPKCFCELERLGLIRIEKRNKVNGKIVHVPSLAHPTQELVQHIFLQIPFPAPLKDKELVVLRGPKKIGSKSPGRQLFLNRRDSFVDSNWKFLQEFNRFTGSSVVTARLIKRDEATLNMLTYAHLRGRITSDITSPVNLKAQIKSKPDDWEFRLVDLNLVRIFNEDLNHGGRFYGSVHLELPREFRPTIKIDGEETTELDFSGLHVRMLYHRKGIEFKDDPYDLGGYPREMYKTPSLMMINAKDEKAARRSIYVDLRTDGSRNGRKYLKKDFDGTVWNFSENLIESFKQRHILIADKFFSNVGIELQYLDSEIMKAVMQRLMNIGVVVLPVHDSIVCKASKANIAKIAMMQEYRNIMGFFPVIK